MTQLEARPSVQETRRKNDTVRTGVIIAVTASLAVLGMAKIVSNEPMRGRTVVNFNSESPVDLPLTRQEALNAIKDKKERKGIKPLPPKPLKSST